LSKAGKVERKTHLKTVRLSESLVRALAKEAASEGTTVNADINSILNQHFEWDVKAKESGFTTIHKTVLRALLDKLDDKTLLQIGRDIVPSWFEEMSEFWFQDSSPERMLDTISLRFKFNPLMRTETTKEGDRYAVVFRHDLGPKWSILAEGAARELVRKFFHVEPQISRGESVVMVRFKANRRNPPTS